MIIIYCDFQHAEQVESSNDVAVVAKVDDYVPLRQRLRRALDAENSHYTVYVQSRILAQWLRDLRDYDPQVVKWLEINLYTNFERKFAFSPPKELNEDAIQDLLQTLPPLHESMAGDPRDWILSQRFDPIWGNTKPGRNHLADLAAWLVKTRHIPAFFVPLLRTRLVEWSVDDSRYRIFLDRPWKKSAEEVILRWVLRAYPVDFNLRQRLEAIPLEDCSQHVDAGLQLLKSNNIPLKQFWNAWFAFNTSQGMITALSWMSGLADAELDVIEKWAKTQPQNLTNELLRYAKERFSHFPRAQSVLERLEKLIPPSMPSKPEAVWSVEKWLDWSTEEYLPYFSWTVRNNQSREMQMNLACQFEEWLIGSYPKMLLDFAAPLSLYQFSRIKELFDLKDVDVILWFIIDGLTWWQGRKLENFCSEQGIGGIRLQPTISVLPTITSISKRALVQGYPGSVENAQPIAQMLRVRLANDAGNIQVYTQYHELEQAFSSNFQPGLHALLYNSLDHHSHDVQGFTDNESIDGHLRLIARLIQEGFEHCIASGWKVKAFVSSDHGSTLLPQHTAVLKVPPFAYVLDDEDLTAQDVPDEGRKVFQRTRVCATDRSPSSSDLQSIKKDWHFLQKDTFSLPKQFLIPKGYAAVERRPKGWTHGGATPEEVIVPSIELQPSKIEFIEPLVKVQGFLQPGKASILQVTLGNANLFPVRVLRLSIANSTVKMKQIVVEPNASVVGEVEVLAAKSKEASQTIEWLLNCEGGGTRENFGGHLNVAVRHLQISDVDEMFEDMP